MRRPVFLIFINAMILIVIFTLLTQSLVIIQRIAVPVKIAGLVEVQRSGRGEFTPMAKGTPIKTGDVVRSGKDGLAEFKWVDGTRWKLMPNTQITVKKATSNWVKKADTSELQLTTGKVFIRIMKELTPASKFEVETPTAVAAVRGTIFSVEVANGKTQVAVFKGHVKVTSPNGQSNKEAMIDPGQAAVSTQPGTLETVSSAAADKEFEAQPSIVQPALTVDIAPTEDNKALIKGSTEAGDVVTINDEATKTLGNGQFRKRVTLQAGKNTFTVVTTDKHGQKTTKVLTMDGAAS